MQGALPVVVDGEVIDAIRASLATPEEDEQVCQGRTCRPRPVSESGRIASEAEGKKAGALYGSLPDFTRAGSLEPLMYRL